MARDDLDIPMPAHAGAAGQRSWRVSRHQSVLDPKTKRILLLAGGAGGAMLLLIGMYSISARHPSGTPVVEADPRPVRERPKNPGGMEIAGADDAILGGASGKEGMAPPPEAPAPAALLAQERAAQTVLPPLPAPAATPAPAAPVVISPAARVAAPEIKPATPAVAAAKPAMAAPAPAAASGAQVQLAALPTEQAALAEWERLSKKMPDMLGSKHPAVSRTERDGKTYFRLRTGGFADVAQATTFCQHVREKGGGCTIATF
jgi:hypothetical protein